MPPQPCHAGAGFPPSTVRSISSLGRASGRGLAAFAAGLVLAALAVPSSLAAQIRTARPRIYMTPESLTALRGVARTDPDINLIAAYVDRRLAASAAAATEATLRSDEPGVVCQPTFFVAAVRGDAGYVSAARAQLLLRASIPADTGWDTGTRNRLFCMAQGYDWVHDQLTGTERATIRDAIVSHVTRIDTYIRMPDYVSGHSRWGNATALAAVIALFGDDTRLDAIRPTVLSNWTAYNAVLADIGRGGGHSMGWQYGPSYSGPEPALMWRSASLTGEVWNADFLRDTAYFHIYAANAAGEYPMSGDCWQEQMNSTTINQIAVASGIAGNGHAETFFGSIPTMLGGLWEPFRVVRAITRNRATVARPIEELPLTRVFEGSGFVVSRDDWTRARATTLVFKSSPFYSLGHHHRDEGSLVLDYLGGLLVEGGEYDYYDSDHHMNFYTRSVAHNTLLVSWTGEPMRAGGYLNDGGQRIPVSWSDEPTTVEALHTSAALGGLAGTSDAGACVWARANLAAAYDSRKLSGYVRDVLEVRRPGGALHPALLVVDRATLPVARASSIHWHFAQNVSIAGQRISAESAGGGRLRLEVLRPSAPRLTSFSGSARWNVGGVAHPPVANDSRTTPYWGRVEVSPAAPVLSPEWSTLLRVGDADLTGDPQVAVDVGGTGWIGARLGNTIFAVASEPVTRFELPSGAALADGCIAGLAPNAVVSVVVGSAGPVRLRANGEGVVVYDPRAALVETDAGMAAADGGASMDAGPMAMDAGGASVDAGSASMDAGPMTMDAGSASMDAALLEPDAGGASVDAALLEPDAGGASVDAALLEPDAGGASVDAQVPQGMDASTPDGAANSPDASDTPPQGTAGCACRAAGAGRGRSGDASLALACGLVMGVAARRRGRRLVVGAARTSGDRERRGRPVEGRPGRPLEGHARPHTR